MKLSIIVPVYNVEEYLERCVRSLEDQDLAKEEYEIIVVNDGSPDNSKQLIEKLQTEFSNIILIDQENQGVSMARNNAIERATGEYILPIDPDDYVLPNTLAHLYNKAHTLQVDVLFAGFEIFDVEGGFLWRTDYHERSENIWEGVSAYFASRGKNVKDPDRSVALLYKSRLLHSYQITYPKDVPFLEDGIFLGKVFIFARRVVFDNERFYQRTTRQGSATNSKLMFSEESIRGFILACKDIRRVTESSNLSPEQTGLVSHLIAKFVLLSLTPALLEYRLFQFFRVLKVLKAEGFSRLELPLEKNRYYKFARIYNHSWCLLLIHRYLRTYL
ncbi:MAG: glycosyltransferase family 2 protein [Imperialibacter sp.]